MKNDNLNMFMNGGIVMAIGMSVSYFLERSGLVSNDWLLAIIALALFIVVGGVYLGIRGDK